MARVLLAKARRFSFDQEEEIVVPLGVLHIAAVLREAGHQVRIYDCGRDWNDPERFRKVLLDYRPDVVGLSSITWEGQVLEGMARVSKVTLPDVPVVAGGPHPSAYPERCVRQPAIDFVAIGEGERTALELVEALTRGGCDPRSVNGIAYYDKNTDKVVHTAPREAIDDLDAMPFPAWDLVDLSLYWTSGRISGMAPGRHMLLFTSRGCPFKCNYCHEVHGKKFRTRSPENIVAEMQTLRDRYGIDDFEFVDDTFNVSRSRVIEVMERVIASKMPVKMHFPNAVRGDLLDEAQIDLLYRAGVKSLCVAVETTSARLQKQIGKHLSVEKIARNIALAVDRGLYVVGFFVIGLPTETYEEARATLEWALRSPLHYAHFSFLTPFAGTAFHDTYREKMLARGFVESDIFRGNFHSSCFNMSEMTDEQLAGLHQEAYRRFLFSPRRALRILTRHPTPRVIIRKGLVALAYSLRSGRSESSEGDEIAWTRAGLEVDPLAAQRQREERVEPARTSPSIVPSAAERSRRAA